MSPEDRALSDGRRDASNASDARRYENQALAWIAAAEAWLSCPASSWTRAREALVQACNALEAAGKARQGQCGGEAVHGEHSPEAPPVEPLG